VIYDRYDVSAVGAILVAAPAAIAHAGALDGSSRCRVTPAPESRSARCALLQIASNMGETDKRLYLQLKPAAVSPFHGFGEQAG
jgi:hypothetical protein